MRQVERGRRLRPRRQSVICSILQYLVGCILALFVLLWRVSCRAAVQNDPRPELRAEGRPYVYAVLHAHQVAAVLVNDDPGIAAMVSRSADGDLLAPSLRVTGVLAMRGSTRKAGRDKGGRRALELLEEHTRRGLPSLLAVDGPQGPRNHVHRGVVDLARHTGATIIPCVIVPSRRWIVRRSWDRFQIPIPFCLLSMTFGTPLDPHAEPDDTRLRESIRSALDDLE
ncbi:MAG: lysophospholipid acyltransferase family protein, partial [Candidatus Rokuibacteriota bacterium]